MQGLLEFALARAASAFVYVFVMGTGREPVAALPPKVATIAQTLAEPAPETETSAVPEAPGAEAKAEGGVEPAKELEPFATPRVKGEAQPPAVTNASAGTRPPAAVAPPADENTYKAALGNTLRSIAKKLYGKPEKC